MKTLVKGNSILSRILNHHWLNYCNYCWWLKSCTTWDVENLVNNGINYLLTGAGFLPSTVGWVFPGATSTLTFARGCRPPQKLQLMDRSKLSHEIYNGFQPVEDFVHQHYHKSLKLYYIPPLKLKSEIWDNKQLALPACYTTWWWPSTIFGTELYTGF